VRRGLTLELRQRLNAHHEAILGQLGETSLVKADLVARLVEVQAIGNRLADLLVTEGPVTSRGRQRTLLKAFLEVVDRQLALSKSIGLERRSKPASSLEAILNAGEETFEFQEN
jgi:hypothetical protein